MGVRDLGYKPYEGVRLPASRNAWVMLRHGLSRAWGSWLVKLTAFTFWVPALIAIGWTALVLLAIPKEAAGELADQGIPTSGAAVLRTLYGVQLWLFLTLVTLGAGAGAISEDLTNKAFQFYFAKPVTREQYLAGRIGAVAFIAFVVTFLPAALVVIAFAGLGAPEQRFEHVGLLLPSLAFSAIIGIVVATGSVAISSLSKSRALTMSAWVLLFVVPHALAGLIKLIGDWPWLFLASLPALLGVVGSALFKLSSEDPIVWFHAAPVLLVVVLGGVLLAYERLRRAEVIA